MTTAPAALSDASPHVLVVDDDTRLRDLLQRFLSENGYRVTTAKDAADARARLAGLRFDLIVLDVMMPGESGLQLTASLRAEDDVPILLLTAMCGPSDRVAGLERGADDYLGKPFEPRELLLRIGTILRRTRRPPASVEPITLGQCRFDPVRGELQRGGEVVRLTSGEVAFLKALASTPGETVSRLELGRRAGSASERAVDVQITRLRRKIEPDPREPRYLKTVWGEGYALWPD